MPLPRPLGLEEEQNSWKRAPFSFARKVTEKFKFHHRQNQLVPRNLLDVLYNFPVQPIAIRGL